MLIFPHPFSFQPLGKLWGTVMQITSYSHKDVRETDRSVKVDIVHVCIFIPLNSPLVLPFGMERKKGEFPMVQWLGLCIFTAKGTGSISGLGTKILQARSCDQKKRKEKENYVLQLRLARLHW